MQNQNKNHLSEIIDFINKSESIALLSHIGPDGDGIGSILALKFALQSLGKNVFAVASGGIPTNYYFLNGAKSFQQKINLDKINREALAKKAKRLGILVEKERSKVEIADEIYKKFCRPKIWQPTFVIHYPIGFQPLAKALEESPKKLANFQLVIGGLELANAFSELNDSIEQRRRFEEEERFFKAGLKEAQRMDEDFLEALEYGMPPAAGFGMGIDRLVALLTNSYSLREIILFPTMRPK